MQILTDALLPLFLALGSIWFAVDIVRKLRRPVETPAPATAAIPPASAPDAPATGVALTPPAPVPAPVVSPAPVAAAAPVDTASAAGASDAVPPPHLAAIAAVVHHLFKGRARIASVNAAGHGHSLPHGDWAREGRRDIFVSHRVR